MKQFVFALLVAVFLLTFVGIHNCQRIVYLQKENDELRQQLAEFQQRARTDAVYLEWRLWLNEEYSSDSICFLGFHCCDHEPLREIAIKSSSPSFFVEIGNDGLLEFAHHEALSEFRWVTGMGPKISYLDVNEFGEKVYLDAIPILKQRNPELFPE